ncbi:MAG: class I SAM-dependent rRNA methyltransferase [Bacteroidetes bacterium]|nr:class I SAM-dependent rRNA methyltransferase [Bacteroidota bacterium]
MGKYQSIYLANGRDEAVRRFHPWIFSGAVKRAEKGIKEGDWVEIFSENEKYLASGYALPGSITVKICSFSRIDPDQNWWNAKLQQAFMLRYAAGLTDNTVTNCYRLIFSEGDLLPGLIIDFYNGTAVMQTHSAFMHDAKPMIAEALKHLYGEKLKAIYDKSADTMAKNTDFKVVDSYLYGESGTEEVVENNLHFKANWEDGQKTGFFLDQRENRKLLQQYAKGRKVLNTFCYTGGFSIYALSAGATLVHSVDSSARAISGVETNVLLNGLNDGRHQAFTIDAKRFLEEMEETYDLIILDPPAFAKHMDSRHKAIKGYIKLNKQAFEKIAPGGILFTFSCSQVVDKQQFYSAVMAAAIESGREVKVLHQLTQPADHPINIFHAEGQYLKGLVLMVY